MRKIKLIATIMSLTMALGLMGFATYAAVNVAGGGAAVGGSVNIETDYNATITAKVYSAVTEGSELSPWSITSSGTVNFWVEFDAGTDGITKFAITKVEVGGGASDLISTLTVNSETSLDSCDIALTTSRVACSMVVEGRTASSLSDYEGLAAESFTITFTIAYDPN